MKAAVMLLALAGLASSHVIEERDVLDKRGMNLMCYFGGSYNLIAALAQSSASAALTYCNSVLLTTVTSTSVTTPTITSAPMATITSTSTSTGVSVVVVSVSSVITTSTITTTLSSCSTAVAAAKVRRQNNAAPTPSLLVGQSPYEISSVCNCLLNAPPTSTVFQTITAPASTVFVKATYTATVLAPVVVTQMSTTTSTSIIGFNETTTTTLTSTCASVVPSPPPGAPAACNANFKSSGSCGCSFQQVCSTRYHNPNGPFDGASHVSAASYTECGGLCDNNSGCIAFAYQTSTGLCVRLFDEYEVLTTDIDNDWAAGGSANTTCAGKCTEGVVINAQNWVKGVGVLLSPGGAPINLPNGLGGGLGGGVGGLQSALPTGLSGALPTGLSNGLGVGLGAGSQQTTTASSRPTTTTAASKSTSPAGGGGLFGALFGFKE